MSFAHRFMSRPLLPVIVPAIALSLFAVAPSYGAAPAAVKPQAAPQQHQTQKPAQSQQGKSQMTRPIYVWKTESDADKQTGKLNHCLVKNMYDNGTVLMLAENIEGEQRLALHFPQDKMKGGDTFDLTMQIDKQDVFPVEALAINPRILTIPLPQGLMDQMRKGFSLFIRGPNDEVVYNLKDMDSAVTALRDCIMTQQEKMQKGTTPSAPKDAQIAAAMPMPAKPAVAPSLVMKQPQQPVPLQPAPQVPPQAKVTAIPPVAKAPVAPAAQTDTGLGSVLPKVAAIIAPEKTIETTTEPLLPRNVAERMASIGLMPDKLLPNSSSLLVQPVDYFWQKGPVLIGLKEAGTSGDIASQAKNYLQGMKKLCHGPFIAEASGLQKNGNAQWMLAETACSNSKSENKIIAMLFVAHGTMLDVFSVSADAASGSDAIKARDAIAKAMAQ